MPVLRSFLFTVVVVVLLSLLYNKLIADAIGFSYRITTLNIAFLIVIITAVNLYNAREKK